MWKTSDRQSLIESVLRGIPLPSIILLRTGAATPHDVVDGKQRLTSILRFIGKHPEALKAVEEAHNQHPEADFKRLFSEDYVSFAKAWKKYRGESLTESKENHYYFPFKLRNNAKGGLVGAKLEHLRGKYYTEIRDEIINAADQDLPVRELFEGTADYRIPVIEYTKASRRQIHEVFKLYNKQGMHLNAEEIRNAVYHDVDLTRAILVAAGDASPSLDLQEVAPALVGLEAVKYLPETLSSYGFGEGRYRRTKVLGWIIAALIREPRGAKLPSTARHTDLLLEEIQDNVAHPLRNQENISRLLDTVSIAAEAHAASAELWPETYRNRQASTRWQDLPLVASLLGVVISTVAVGEDVEHLLTEHTSEIKRHAKEVWQQDKKSQTITQWKFIGTVSLDIPKILGLDVDDIAAKLVRQYGSSGLTALDEASKVVVDP